LALVYLLRDKQHEQALVENTRALVAGPNWFSAHVIQGVILNSMGRPEETIALADQAFRLSPRSFNYLSPLGNAYRLTKRYDEAIATFKKILAVMPHNPTARLGLATAYAELGREEEARAEAAEVLQISPQFSLEALQQRLPYKDPAETDRQLVALRKAGLK
jgi:adenylate cyclase